MNIFPATPAQFVVELMLDAALAGILHADGADHLRRQIARRIKTLRLLLEMDALQVQRLDALDRLVIGLARHPAKSLVIAAVRQHYVVVFAGDARDQRHRRGQVFYFGGHSECGIHEHRHCQLVTGAVINDAALGGKRNLALLLVFRLPDKAAVAKNLQIN